MKIRTALVATLAAASGGAPAYSQQMPLCGPAAEILPSFAAEYGEHTIASGLSPRGYVVVYLANPTTGTWTVFRLSAEGVACIVDAGDGLQLLQPATPGEPS